MSFQPVVGQELVIGQLTYRVAEHPSAPGMPYGQQGRKATVFQLNSDAGAMALKVFLPRFREPQLATLADRIGGFGELPGLTVCRRTVLTARRHTALQRQHPDLAYAILMPWIEGPTWMEVVLGQEAFSPERSLWLARALAGVLVEMEERGLAHGDLSGGNLLLPGLLDPLRPAPVELVDVEELYAAGLDRPNVLPAGSPGYAHRSAPEGLWGPESDRFAGAVLLAEMLGWCDERVRSAAWGEGYFAPDAMQGDNEAFVLLARVLRERWGPPVEGLLNRVWESERLRDCPTFSEWLVALPDEVPVMGAAASAAAEAPAPLDAEALAPAPALETFPESEEAIIARMEAAHMEAARTAAALMEPPTAASPPLASGLPLATSLPGAGRKTAVRIAVAAVLAGLAITGAIALSRRGGNPAAKPADPAPSQAPVESVSAQTDTATAPDIPVGPPNISPAPEPPAPEPVASRPIESPGPSPAERPIIQEADDPTPVGSAASDEAASRVQQAQALMQQGNAVGAIAELNTAVSIDPSYAPAWALLGKARGALGIDAMAVSNFTTALRYAPDDPDVLMERGRIYKRMDKTDLAIGDFRQVVALSKDPNQRLAAQMLLRELGVK